MAVADALVNVDSVVVDYDGQTRALDPTNLTIPRGQFVAIVGPSGCGKSTLLRLLAGLLAPTSGTLTVAGATPAQSRADTRLSYVFQEPTLLAWRTVSANVRLPLELARAPRTAHAARVNAALAMVGLGEFASRYPDQLSGGMKMRVSLARALVTQPELLLLDEPFGALDDLARQTLGEELRGLWQRHRWTAVFVTHNIAEAVWLAERVIVLSPRPGRIVADVAVALPAERAPSLRATAEFARITGEVAARLGSDGT